MRSAQGEETVVWRREETAEQALNGVEASARHAGGGWQHTVLYSSGRNGPNGIALGGDAGGHATLAWLNLVPDSSSRRIEALEHPPNGGWRRPVRVIHGKIEPDQIALAVAPDGRAALAFDTENEGVQLALRGSNGRWSRSSAPQRGGRDHSPQVVMLPGGGAAIAWVRGPSFGSGQSVQAVVVGPRGRAAGPVQTLSSGDQHEVELHLAGNRRGDLVLVWRPRGASGPLVAATRDPGARFATPVVISPGRNSEVSAAVDTRGDATVLFTHLLAENVAIEKSNQGLAPTKAQRTVVQDATRPAASAWRSPVAIPAPVDMSTLAPRIVASPTSDALLAAWTSAPQRAVFGNEVGGGWPPEAARDYASMRVGAGPWETPLPVSPPNVSPAVIALDDRGNATAAWVSYEEAPEASHPFATVEASEYTP